MSLSTDVGNRPLNHRLLLMFPCGPYSADFRDTLTTGEFSRVESGALALDR